jgi:hypothetical protein
MRRKGAMNTFPHRAAAVLAVLAMAVWPAAADMKAADTAYAKLLSKYLNSRGIRYAAWRTSGDDLKLISEVVMIYRNAELKELEPEARKALYINLYNAKVLETVLLQNPSGSIRALSKPLNPNEIFKRPAMMFDGRNISLNGLEKRLRDEFKDPRIHFAINCASRSCPPIRGEPYAAERIDAQLDDATRRFLASPDGIVVRTKRGDTTLVVSQIFTWYKDDFKPVGGVLGFIKTYGPQEASDAAAARKARLDDLPYDWGLNVSD